MSADDDKVTFDRETLGLIGDLMGASIGATHHVTNQLMSAYLAETLWLRHGLEHALGGWARVSGGTVREYEALLGKIERALYPSPEVRDFYHRVAERYLAGEERLHMGEFPRYPGWSRGEIW